MRASSTSGPTVSSNVTCLWQRILWADGYLPYSGIDGIFGDQTHAATVKWQKSRGLIADGSVGKATFPKAGKKFVDHDLDGYYRKGAYWGSNGSFPVRRPRSAGNWQFVSADGFFVRAAHNWKSR